MTALLTVLSELIDGPAPGAAWVLNPEDSGLISSLDSLTAQQASAAPSSGGASIAAHVDHLRYGLALLNRSVRGEKPFLDADYAASWQRGTVSNTEWAAQREALRSRSLCMEESAGGLARRHGRRTDGGRGERCPPRVPFGSHPPD